MNREELPPTASPEEPLPEAHHAGLMARFRNYFLTGLVVAGPVAITFYLTWWFVNWVDSIVRPFVPTVYRPETYLPKSKIIEVDMSTEDAATLIMSAGVVQPGSDPQKRNAAALAGMANAARVANSAALQPAPAKVKVE